MLCDTFLDKGVVYSDWKDIQFPKNSEQDLDRYLFAPSLLVAALFRAMDRRYDDDVWLQLNGALPTGTAPIRFQPKDLKTVYAIVQSPSQFTRYRSRFGQEKEDLVPPSIYYLPSTYVNG